MDSLQLQLCDIQGRLFALSGNENIPSEAFIRAFAVSDAARGLDSQYNKMQWMGEGYLLEDVKDSAGDAFSRPGEVYGEETLYWTGYIYRYWHYYTGENSREILRQAPPQTMRHNYLMFHTMAPELAIEDLKEIYNQKTKKRKNRKNEEGTR